MIQDPESGTNTGVIFGCGRMLIAVLNIRNEARKLLSPQMLPSFSKRHRGKKKAIYEDLSSYRYMITGATKETLFRTELTGQEKKSLL